jgi:hypothetical protein
LKSAQNEIEYEQNENNLSNRIDEEDEDFVREEDENSDEGRDEEDDEECAESRPITPGREDSPIQEITEVKNTSANNPNKLNSTYRGAFTCKI